MSYLKLFLDDSKTLIKPKIVAVEEDWEFLCQVYPEPGFRSYFPGFVISALAKHLKSHGIYTYFDRADRPEFAELARLLSDIKFVQPESTGKTVVYHDPRGTGRAHHPIEGSPGESADVQVSSAQGHDGGKTKEIHESEDPRPESAWSLTQKQQATLDYLRGYGFKPVRYIDARRALIVRGQVTSIVIEIDGKYWSSEKLNLINA